MAIKSKGRSKSKQPARAPRRAPVAVPKPFFQRRWVQVVGALLVGMFVLMLFVWVTNGLRRDDRSSADEQARNSRKSALVQLQSVLEPQIGTIGTLNGPLPPTVAPGVSAAADAVAANKHVTTTAHDLLAQARTLNAVAAKIDAFDLATTIRNQGFDVNQAEALSSAKTEIVSGLQGLEQAARLAALAMNAEGATRARLAASAKAVSDTSKGLIEDGYNTYVNALIEAGIAAGGSAPGGGSQLIGGS